MIEVISVCKLFTVSVYTAQAWFSTNLQNCFTCLSSRFAQKGVVYLKMKCDVGAPEGCPFPSKVTNSQNISNQNVKTLGRSQCFQLGSDSVAEVGWLLASLL
jgi:hypothetical protein